MGTFAGSIGDVPVFNVAVPVLGRDFWIFELGAGRGQTPERVQTPDERERGQTPERAQRSRREKASRPRPPRTSA